WPIAWTGQPHTAMVLAQPFVLLAVILVLLTFFLTAMVCHGELARDRPGKKHLTEFYLWMSVGGMLGGLLNALIAPVGFWGGAELPSAIVIACLLRPYVTSLPPLERRPAIYLGVGAGLMLGLMLIAVQPLLLVVCPILGGLLGGFYQHNFQREGWT